MANPYRTTRQFERFFLGLPNTAYDPIDAHSLNPTIGEVLSGTAGIKGYFALDPETGEKVRVNFEELTRTKLNELSAVVTKHIADLKEAQRE